MQAYGQTDTGCVRTRNQDYIYFSPEQTGDLENLFFLADGMGGYQAGDYASWYAVEELVRYMKEQKGVPLVKRFQEGIAQVNSRLFRVVILWLWRLQREPDRSSMAQSRW